MPKAAEGGGFSCPVVVACPGVRVCKVIAAEILDASIDVDVVHVAVEFIPVEAVAVGMVPAIITIGVVSTEVTAVPGRIPVERAIVVKDSTACPITSPGRPAPAATTERAECDSSTK